MQTLQLEIAAIAAQLIAEEGLDYASAKREAAGQIGPLAARLGRERLPSNEQVEAALRTHLALYHADTQPQLLRARRESALRLMDALAPLELWLLGAVANGTATEFSGLFFAAVADSAKELGITLLNRGIDYEAVLLEDSDGREDEGLHLLWEDLETQIRVVPRAQGLRRLSALSRSELQALLAPSTLSDEHTTLS